jgi:hypothetical protein
MKRFKTWLMALFCLGLLLTCSESIKDDPINQLKNGSVHGAEITEDGLKVTVPFKANLTVWNHTDPTDRSCGEIPIFSVTMKGEGVINHMGKTTTVMTFCNDVSNGDYWDTNVIFIAANGDELYAAIPSGKVIPNEEDNSNYYSARFDDDMYFIGGTGRFEGAEGHAKTNAYVHLPTDDYKHKGDEIWHTDFFSHGELILPKGK